MPDVCLHISVGINLQFKGDLFVSECNFYKIAQSSDEDGTPETYLPTERH